ncbi:MAG: excinuclease ABC subunit UvrB [Patescibacteria group bacterium]
MALFKLKSHYQPAGDQPQAINKLNSGVKKGFDFQTLLGVTGSGKTFIMANVIASQDKPVLVLAPNKTLAAQLYREYKNYFPDNSVNYFVSYYDYYQPEAYLPITDTYIEKEAMINQEIDRLRHQATSALVTRRDVIIVASVSCIYNLGLPENYYEGALTLQVDKEFDRTQLIKNLIKMQFLRTKGEMSRGEFRLRGDVFEIMPAESPFIYRFKLIKNKLQELWVMDATTRKIKEQLKEILIFPTKHFVSYDNKTAIRNIKQEAKERIAYFKKRQKLLEAERIKRRIKYDMEMLKTLGYCNGIENYSRHLLGKSAGEPPDTLLAYFSKKNNQPDFLTIIDESHIAVPQVRGMYAGDRSRKQTLVDHGWRLPSALDNRPLNFAEFSERIGSAIFTSATPADWEKEKSRQIVEQIIRPTGLVDPVIDIRPVLDIKNNISQVDDLMKELDNIVLNKERALVNTLTKKMAEDFSDFLIQKGYRARWMHSGTKTIERTEILTSFRQGEFDILIGVNLLREGLDLPEVTLVAIFDADREGFLRSQTSLIQTMGRAARNVKGKIILYADRVTGSLARAVQEVERRRKKQLAYNKKNHITPKTIKKKIEDLLITD